MAEPYSPLRYPGGKAKLAEFLVAVLRCNRLHQPHYVEPYAGGAGAALRLLFEEYVEGITINDADPRIRCFWQAVTKYNDAFLALIEDVEVTVEEWRQQRMIYEKRDLRRILQLGFATFFLNRTARSGIIHNGGPIGGYDQSGNFKIDARFNRGQLIRRIQRIGAYSDRIRVSGDDGLALLKKLNHSPTQAKQTFVYLDPPYYAKGPELYLNRFTHDQHARLAAYLSTPKNFPWILTYDNVPAVRSLYVRFPQICFSLSYSAYGRREGQELLIHPELVVIPPSATHALLVAC
ncbi:MAG: DNA adenine methylase [Sedimentisphaerales bacterium]|nr:DNA adenine methylase [Sedimentisphaerales bacterium]HNY77888.1 DNA adenine methylase [Sedimentisphaerales bacterium]HOC63063.1 DNA adenine methylase [Sedimentisphaerales bacterium]HOH64063.1 DNA adenine methylase [Sedimentisphaerales bacterium]HPY49073.1 DNA adenine methylase [Sedimentisphaerales bacterium]